MNRLTILTFTAVLALSGCGDSCVTGPASTAGMTEVEKAYVKAESPWIQHAKICRMGPYVVTAPADAVPGEIYVKRNGTTLSMDELGTIGILSKNGSLVSVRESGETGHIDMVSYDVIDPTDGQKYSVTDADADGRLDTKIGDHGGFVNLNGQWSKLEKRGSQLGAIVDGEWRPIEKQGKGVFQLKPP